MAFRKIPPDLPHPRIKLKSPALADRFFTTAPTGKQERMGRSLKAGKHLKQKVRIDLGL